MASVPALLTPATSCAGNGLAGLTERVTALGGWCEAGPQAAGGFRLSVSLPPTRENGDEGAAAEIAGSHVERIAVS